MTEREAAAIAIRKMGAALDRAQAENRRFREALEEIATSGGWRTTWRVDEAEPERGEQPTIANHAQEIARDALGPVSVTPDDREPAA